MIQIIYSYSLIPKLHEVKFIAQKTKAACICISESWLNDSVPDAEVHIDNYCLQRKDRNRHGGGVCIYIRSDLSFNIRSDLYHDDLEAIWIDLFLPKSKPILCGAIYRPPTQQNFYTILDLVCSRSRAFLEQETILLGDFNTDVSVNSKVPLLQSFKSFINMFHFNQLICEPTRYCTTSATVIDLILVSEKDKISQVGVINTSFSDHCLIYCTRKSSKSFFGCHNNVTIRSTKQYDMKAFQNCLLNTDCSQILLSNNVNDAWNNFRHLFLSVLDNVAPIKQIRLKQRSEPWIDNEILEAIEERDKAFKLYVKNKNVDNFNYFKSLRNKVQDLVKSAKSNYFSSVIEENKHDSKSLWKTLKNLGLPSKKASNISNCNISLNVDGNVCFEKMSIAETFNRYFTTIACKLVDKLPKSTGLYGEIFVTNFYSKFGVRLNCFSFSLMTEGKILKYLNSLSPNKATGLDGLPSRFIKDGAPIIAGPLTHIINLSLIQGIIPTELKCAKIVPLYKKNDRLSVGNYRPVSILNVFSKVIEKVVYDQVNDYLKEKHLIYKFQSGFRSGFSTDTCLLHLIDYIRLEHDKGNVVGMILLDLQKAFDTVNHSILLSKLKACGLGNDICNWFSSYLSERQQLVDVFGTFSNSLPVTCGVPQGSILGPLLFLLYVNDMPAVVKNKLLLYADDSAILVSGKNISQVEQALSEDLFSVSQWLVDNKLSLHLGKTESILFGSKRKLHSESNLKIKCNETSISSTSSVKYLGVTIDQFLSFKDMAETVIKKANARLSFLYRKKEYLNFQMRKLLFTSLIQCHFDYASAVWYNGLTQNLKNKLQTTQNKLIRFIFDLDPKSHIGSEHFRILNWLPVQSRVEQIMLCQVFKINKNVAPEYLKQHFVAQTAQHNHRTRLSVKGGYSIPKVKTSGSKTFCYVATKIWNNLPRELTTIDKYKPFKIAVKDFLLSKSK